MKTKIIALIVLALIVSLPITIAQNNIEIVDESSIYNRDVVGEDIIINVDEYQPSTIRSSLIEEQNINIYALLKGIPSNPTIAIDRIRTINVRPTQVTTVPEGKDVELGTIRYIKPGRQNNGYRDLVYDAATALGTGSGRIPQTGDVSSATRAGAGFNSQIDYDNLGHIQVPIKRIEKEENVPEEINIELEGTIEFDVGSGLNFGKTTDVLTEMGEAEWLPTRENHRFYGGYIRVDEIGSGRNAVERVTERTKGDLYARIVLYDLNGQPLRPVLGSEIDPEGRRDLAIEGGAVELRVGETTAQSFRSSTTGTSSDLFNRFKVKLEDIRPTRPNIGALVQQGDSLPVQRKLGEGARVHEDSGWRLMDVRETTENGRKKFYLEFRNDNAGVPPKTLEITELSGRQNNITTIETAPNCQNVLTTREYQKMSLDDLKDLAAESETQINQDKCVEENLAVLQNILEEYRLRQRQAVTDEERLDFATKVNSLSETIERSQGRVNGILTKEGETTEELRAAIVEYQQFIYDYNNLEDNQKVDLEDKYVDALEKLAILYDELGDESRAISTYRTLLNLPTSINAPKHSYYQTLINSLENSQRFSISKIILPERGRPDTIVTITASPESLIQNAPKATITIGKNAKRTITIQEGQPILGALTLKEGGSTKYNNWYVKTIDLNGITLENRCSGNDCLERALSTEFIRDQEVDLVKLIDSGKTGPVGNYLDGSNAPEVDVESGALQIELVSTQVSEEAVISIIPVAERAFSAVNFNLHLGIEPRAIELPLFSGSLDKEINNTQELIEQLDDVIENVGELHKFWSNLCLITFGTLWAKNLFSINEGQSRREINPDWRRQYQEDVNNKKFSGTFDSYLIEHSDDYNKDLELTEELFDRIDNKEHYAVATDLDIDLTEKQLQEGDTLFRRLFIAREKAAVNPEIYLNELITSELAARNYADDQKIAELAQSITAPAEITAVLGTIDDTKWRVNKAGYISTYRSRKQQINLGRVLLGTDEVNLNKPLASIENFNEGIEAFKDRFGLSDDLNDELQTSFAGLAGIVDQSLVQQGALIPETSLLLLPVSGGKQRYYRNSAVNAEYPLFTLNQGASENLNAPEELSDTKKYTPLKEDISAVIDKDVPVYYRIDNRIQKVQITSQSITLPHQPIVTRYDSGRNEGKLQRITADGEWYIEAEYGIGGRVAKQACRRSAPNSNPGGPGEECQDLTNSFVQDLAKIQPDSATAIRKADSCITQINRNFERDILPSNIAGTDPAIGSLYSCDGTAYSVGQNAPEPVGASCVDFMDPTDCQILFNACDPVICPASRCNLGGEWQVENVVQTGLVGSVFLCAPNFPEVAVPVCITGIRAGLQNIKSILEGYEQCLITQKNEGKPVGICDRIRNVYVCEILWREGLAIFNVKGGFLSLVGEKIFGGGETGGGEYSDFQNHFKNSVSGLEFFTQSYAKNVFAGYDGGSLDEIGTQICKSAIFGKVPGVGNFFDEIQKPESPPQFIAFFDEAPYSDITSIPQSIYSVYYHIYAGDNEDARYSVFLRGVDGSGNLLTDFKFLENNKPLKKGESVDINKDLVAIQGYNELCVSIKTQRYGLQQECGFGKVSSNFALNYLNEQYVKGEATKEISTADECVSESSRLTSLSYQNGNVQGSASLTRAAVGSVSTGVLQSGIVRKCSVVDPNIGIKSGEDVWQIVGSCGQDEQGRALGQCYIHVPSYQNALSQQYTRDQTKEGLEKLGNKIQENGGFETPELTNEETTKTLQEGIAARESAGGTECNAQQYNLAITKFRNVADYGSQDGKRVEAQYQVAETYKDWHYCITRNSAIAETGRTQQETTQNNAGSTSTQSATVDLRQEVYTGSLNLGKEITIVTTTGTSKLNFTKETVLENGAIKEKSKFVFDGKEFEATSGETIELSEGKIIFNLKSEDLEKDLVIITLRDTGRQLDPGTYFLGADLTVSDKYVSEKIKFEELFKNDVIFYILPPIDGSKKAYKLIRLNGKYQYADGSKEPEAEPPFAILGTNTIPFGENTGERAVGSPLRQEDIDTDTIIFIVGAGGTQSPFEPVGQIKSFEPTKEDDNVSLKLNDGDAIQVITPENKYVAAYNYESNSVSLYNSINEVTKLSVVNQDVPVQLPAKDGTGTVSLLVKVDSINAQTKEATLTVTYEAETL